MEQYIDSLVNCSTLKQIITDITKHVAVIDQLFFEVMYAK